MSDDNTAVPSSAKDRQALKLMLVEMTKCMQTIDGERQQIGDIASAAEEAFGIKKKIIRKLATTMFKHNYADVQSEHEHFEYLYEALIEGKKDSEAA
jgi:hypothetical protein